MYLFKRIRKRRKKKARASVKHDDDDDFVGVCKQEDQLEITRTDICKIAYSNDIEISSFLDHA